MSTRPRATESAGRSSGRLRSVRVGALLFVVALGIAAAGCGGGESSSSDQSVAEPGSATTEATTAAETQTTPTQTTPDLEGYREFGMTDEEFPVRIETAQSVIATCMTEAGFEYVPADVETIELAMSAVRTEPGVDEAEFKAQWGYGITTRFDNRVKEIELGEQNLAYFAGLSQADQEAYERTLYGEDPDATFAFTFDEEDFSGTGGCTRQAVEQAFTPEQLNDTYVNPKDVLVESDPRVVEARANWVTCMQDAGYDDYVEQDEIIEEYQDRLDALTDGEDPETLTGARAEELKQLQQEEIAAAVVDERCQVEFLSKVVRAVELEVFGTVVSG